MDNVQNLLAQIMNLQNTQAPIIGPIRKFNQQTFGTPDYANPNKSREEQMMALVMAMGLKGGSNPQAARQFGQSLRNAAPKWASKNLLNEKPQTHFVPHPQDPRKLIPVQMARQLMGQ